MSDSTGSGVSRPEVWRLSDADLVATVADNEIVTRQRQAARYELISQLVARGIPARRGYGRVEAYLSDVFHISRSEATKWIRRAVALHPTQGLTGPIPPKAPATAKAAADGAVGDEHIDVVLDLLERIPDDVPVDERDGYEKAVAEYQRVATPAAARKLVERIIALVDPDGTLPKEKDLARPARELITSWTRSGHLAFKGRLDAETGQALEALLSPLTKPRPAEDGTPDPRPVEQRNGKTPACSHIPRVPGSGTRVPDSRVQLKVPGCCCGESANPELARGPEPGTRATDPISAEQARRLACDAEIIPAVLGSHGEVLDLGRSQRLVNRAQRRALNLRDGGCIFPNCPRPARWTEAHHIIFWIFGGPTDIANLCLLCAEHHRLIHHSEWEIRMAEDGHPECIPPTYIDPEQKPRRNYAQHHL